MDDEENKVSKRILNTAARYVARLRAGEKMMRDSQGRVQWADGRNVGYATYNHMISEGIIKSLDTDLFGERSRGQSIGLSEDYHG